MQTPYTLVRTNRKTVAIYVRPDRTVEVRAPQHISHVHIEAFVAQKQRWIQNAMQKIDALRLAPNQIILSHGEQIALQRQARQFIPTRTAYWSKKIGVVPNAVKINSAKTHWGSCTAKNNLNFSWLLMLAQPDEIDYVIIHELCHIIHHNHSPRFWTMVQQHCPNYEFCRQQLRALERRCNVSAWEPPQPQKGESHL